MSSLPETYKAAVLDGPNAKFALRQVPLKKPGPGQVLVKVLACGVCHSDGFEQLGHLANPWPIVPGHELVGDVVAIGSPESSRFKIGDRVGGPWHGGHDSTCRSCQRAMFQMCESKVVNGVSMDGGYAEYVLLRSEAVVRVPRTADPAEVAPLLCAGVTVFNSLRKLHVPQGALVAVQGLGGLGHLGVQYASRMGYRVVVLSRGGAEKEAFARELGGHEFIDTSAFSAEEVNKKLQAMGGADVVLATAPNPAAMAPLIHGLAVGGKLVSLAPVGPIEVDTVAMTGKGLSVHCWPSGHALDSEEAIAFADTHGFRSLVERFPFDKVQEAFDHMMANKARFRAVLVME